MTKDVTENSPLMALYVLLIMPPEGASTIYYSLDKKKRYCNGSGGTWPPDQVDRSHKETMTKLNVDMEVYIG